YCSRHSRAPSESGGRSSGAWFPRALRQGREEGSRPPRPGRRPPECTMQRPLVDVVAEATRLYVAGNRPQAEALCQQALRQEPDNADALPLLGLLANDAGKPYVAIELISRALARQPTAHNFHNNLGLALAAAGLRYAAAEHFKEALRLNPGDVLARANLGNLY